ncbi:MULTISPECIES: hypothetical protein [Actinosynnema]|uniref:hypothetical protein n=1 Tax=Actinosynnema TaxID=40566 RepID=UPI0020A37B16|nr:hypothetical protein [Actinosynnema pretiosum]MCP2098189.1 hypothetical protein [Actinosynnema pretiosum]
MPSRNPELLAFPEPDESPHAGQERLTAEVLRTYVRLLRDEIMPLALQDRFIAEADALAPGAPFQVHELDSTHINSRIPPEGAARAQAEAASGLC